MKEKVAILGASEKPERYSYLAFKMLQEYGHQVFPVSPRLKELEGSAVYADLAKLPPAIDTLTMYVGPETSTKLKAEILKLHPRRVIFNPGSENPELEKELTAAGVEVLEACTLVLLRAQQFENHEV